MSPIACSVESCGANGAWLVWDGTWVFVCDSHKAESAWFDEQDALARVEDEARG